MPTTPATAPAYRDETARRGSPVADVFGTALPVVTLLTFFLVGWYLLWEPQGSSGTWSRWS